MGLALSLYFGNLLTSSIEKHGACIRNAFTVDNSLAVLLQKPSTEKSYQTVSKVFGIWK